MPEKHFFIGSSCDPHVLADIWMSVGDSFMKLVEETPCNEKPSLFPPHQAPYPNAANQWGSVPKVSPQYKCTK